MLLSLALSFVDSYSRLLAPFRSAIAIPVTPIYFIANFPYRLGDGIVKFFEPRETLQQKNLELKERNLKLQQMMQKYAPVYRKASQVERQVIFTTKE